MIRRFNKKLINFINLFNFSNCVEEKTFFFFFLQSKYHFFSPITESAILGTRLHQNQKSFYESMEIKSSRDGQTFNQPTLLDDRSIISRRFCRRISFQKKKSTFIRFLRRRGRLDSEQQDGGTSIPESCMIIPLNLVESMESSFLRSRGINLDYLIRESLSVSRLLCTEWKSIGPLNEEKKWTSQWTKHSPARDHEFGAVSLEQAYIMFNTALYHNSGGPVFVIPLDFRRDFGVIAFRVTVLGEFNINDNICVYGGLLCSAETRLRTSRSEKRERKRKENKRERNKEDR